jgi:GT2 family glycosyltransferase
MTRKVLECLRAQEVDQPLNIVVIDDGSTDGTFEFLSKQHNDVTVLQGDGNLWWGGAVDLGLRHALRKGKQDDWVLLVNNDVRFSADFIQGLLHVARANTPAAVGSVICDEAAPNYLLSIGAEIDTWRLGTRDKLECRRQRNTAMPLHQVDALSGRGTLYPLEAFRMAGCMSPKLLPHHLADYELAVRVRNAGYRLLVSEQVAIISADDFSNGWKPPNFLSKLSSVRSPYYLPAVLTFWWRASSLSERFSLLPRLFYRLSR